MRSLLLLIKIDLSKLSCVTITTNASHMRRITVSRTQRKKSHLHCQLWYLSHTVNTLTLAGCVCSKAKSMFFPFPLDTCTEIPGKGFSFLDYNSQCKRAMVFRSEHLNETRKSDEKIQSLLTCNVGTSENKNTGMVTKITLGQQRLFSSQILLSVASWKFGLHYATATAE